MPDPAEMTIPLSDDTAAPEVIMAAPEVIMADPPHPQPASTVTAALAHGSLHPPQGAQSPAWLTPADASTAADILTKLAIHFTAIFL